MQVNYKTISTSIKLVIFPSFYKITAILKISVNLHWCIRYSLQLRFALIQFITLYTNVKYIILKIFSIVYSILNCFGYVVVINNFFLFHIC